MSRAPSGESGAPLAPGGQPMTAEERRALPPVARELRQCAGLTAELTGPTMCAGVEQMFQSGTGPESRVPASASLLWSQRHNPAWMPVTTFVARFTRSETDASVWLSTDGLWTAELRRAARGNYVYLAIWRHGTLLGTYDERRGWQAAGAPSSLRRKRTVARQLAFAS